jgi:hypothetical protein
MRKLASTVRIFPLVTTVSTRRCESTRAGQRGYECERADRENQRAHGIAIVPDHRGPCRSGELWIESSLTVGSETGCPSAERRRPVAALYGPDGFHPSPAGTYLAALVIYQQISGRSVVGSPSPLSSVDPTTVRVLQESAAEATDRFALP